MILIPHRQYSLILYFLFSLQSFTIPALAFLPNLCNFLLLFHCFLPPVLCFLFLYSPSNNLLQHSLSCQVTSLRYYWYNHFFWGVGLSPFSSYIFSSLFSLHPILFSLLRHSPIDFICMIIATVFQYCFPILTARPPLHLSHRFPSHFSLSFSQTFFFLFILLLLLFSC